MGVWPALASVPINGVLLFLCRYLPEEVPWMWEPGAEGQRLLVNERLFWRIVQDIPPQMPEPHEYTVERIRELLREN